jgi:hypothetical protein
MAHSFGFDGNRIRMNMRWAVVLVVCLSFGVFLPHCVGQNYAPAVNYIAQSGPDAITSGDFNKDGNLDVVVANGGSSSLSLFLGKGDGTFGTATTIPVGPSPNSEPTSVTAADYNGDGTLDIAVSFALSSSIQVLFGNGDGTFQSPIAVAIPGLGQFPVISQVTAVDLNSDLKPDLLAATSNGVQILLNEGAGSFVLAAPAFAGRITQNFVVADFNDDHRLDIAANDISGPAMLPGTLLLSFGNGDGTFQSPVLLALSTHTPTGIAAADLDGDGLVDLVVSDFGVPPSVNLVTPGAIYILLQQRDGSFLQSTTLNVVPHPGPVLVADLNGDGHPDIAALYGAPSEVMVYLGQGGASFSSPNQFPVLALPNGFVTGSFANSNAADIVTADLGANAISVLVNQGGDSLDLASSMNPSLISQPVTLTATVRPKFSGSGPPSGSVIFSDGNTTLGTFSVNSSGSASLTTNFSSAGRHSLLAVFSGNGGLVTASARLNQVVDQATPSVTITSSVSPSFAGHPVAFSITVSAGGAGPVPTGNVDVTSDGSVVFSGTLDGTGKVSFTTTALPAGADVVTAHYAGDSNYPSVVSSPFNQTVSQNTDTTTLTVAPNPSVFGQSVNFTATVTSTLAGSPQPTGAVRFSDAGNFVVAGDVDNLGRATVAVNSQAAGTHNIVASYSGDANFAPSISAASALAVNKAPTTIALVALPSASVVGQSVTVTATVTASTAIATPTGAVSFSDGANLIGTATLDQGKATVRVPFLTPGTHLIAARYAGDVDFAPSMSNAGALSEVVGPSNTVVVPSSTVNPSVYGQALSFTVIVSASGGGGGIPNGTVLLADGNSSLGTVALDSTGKGALTIASLGMGSHSITATYSGSASYLPSTSSGLTQVVNRDPVLVTVTSVPNPSTVGQNVSFSVQVTPAQPGGSAGTAAPTGTIVLNDATTILGSATLNSTGKAQISTSSVSAGSHVLIAAYQGDANFLNGSSGQFTHVVTKLSATAALSSSQNPTTNASALTLTAKINSNAPGTPSGTVTLSDGAQQLSSSQISNTGIAIFQVSNPAVGDHTFSVSYSGDSTFLGTQSPSVNETVVDSHSTVTLASSANPQDLGKPISFVATVTPALGGIASTGNVVFLDGSASLASVPGQQLAGTVRRHLFNSGGERSRHSRFQYFRSATWRGHSCWAELQHHRHVDAVEWLEERGQHSLHWGSIGKHLHGQSVERALRRHDSSFRDRCDHNNRTGAPAQRRAGVHFGSGRSPVWPCIYRGSCSTQERDWCPLCALGCRDAHRMRG